MPCYSAARLSQAFTTTHSSVRIRADQVESVPDVTMGRYLFTESVSIYFPHLEIFLMSPSYFQWVWEHFPEVSRRDHRETV